MSGPAYPGPELSLVVGYLRADTPALAAPLAEALARHAETRGLGPLTAVFRDRVSGRDAVRPGFAACLQVCALAVTGRAVILVPTPAHLAGNGLLTGALLSQARGVRATVTYLDGRPDARADWAADQPVADPALAPAPEPAPPAPPLPPHRPGDWFRGPL